MRHRASCYRAGCWAEGCRVVRYVAPAARQLLLNHTEYDALLYSGSTNRKHLVRSSITLHLEGGQGCGTTPPLDDAEVIYLEDIYLVVYQVLLISILTSIRLQAGGCCCCIVIRRTVWG